MIFIKTDSAIETLERLNAKLSAAQIARVESRAINKTLGQARTIARREVKKVYNISQKDLGGINYKPSNPTTVTGKLVASRKPIPLDAFAPKQETGGTSIRVTKKGAQKVTIFKRAKSNPTAGVSIEIFKGKRIVIPFAFMIPGGAVRVFARGQYKTGTQYGFVQRFHRVNSEGSDIPIKPLITISTFGEILNDKVMGQIGKDVKRIYPEQFENQVEYLLSTIG
jgi:hypothetical protein